MIASAGTAMLAVLTAAIVAGLDVVPAADSSWGARWEAVAGAPSTFQREALAALSSTVLLIAAGCCLVAALSLLVHSVSRLLAIWKALAVRCALGAGLRQLFAGIAPELGALTLLGSFCGIIAGAAAGAGHRFTRPDMLTGLPNLAMLLLVPGALVLLALLLLAVVGPLLLVLHRGRRITGDLAGDGVTSGAMHLRLQHALAMVQLAALLIVTYGGALILSASPLAAPREVQLDTNDAAILPLRLGATVTPRQRSAALASLSAALGTEVAIASPGAWLGLGKAQPLHSICTFCFRGPNFVPMTFANVRAIAVMPGTLEAMGLPLVGASQRIPMRTITAADGFDAPRVVVISRQAAATLFPGGNPIGQTLRTGLGSSSDYTVVGIVRDFAPRGLGAAGRPIVAVYYSALQHPPQAVEAAIPDGAGPVVRRRFRSLAAAAGFAASGPPQPVRSQMRRFAEPVHWFARVVAVLLVAGTALALYAFGAVMMQLVAIRRRDIAIRLALGARPWHVVRWITGRGVVVALYGVAIGAGGARWLGDVLSKALRRSDEGDVVILLGMCCLFALVGFLASYVPARIASRIDPAAIWRQR